MELQSLHHIVAEIDADLAQRLAAAKLPDNLRQAVEYSVLGGGKRLRPLLTLLCCEALGGKRQHALGSAGAIELVHCFSLVHDDLPAMDDDDLRRGRPTLHRHAGEAMAILAGDVMLSLAFEFITASSVQHDRHADLVNELSIATTAMIAGQVYDTLGGFKPGLSDLQKLHVIHHNKTGALIRAACRMGAMCGNASETQLASLTTYGDSLGLMFQIVDDLLDVTQSAEHIGKATGKDHSAGKLTFPGLLGIPESRTEISRLHQEALNSLQTLGPAAEPLRDLCDYMAVRTK
jgi:geranylgeranyl diphosphate synthase, type II